MSQSGPSYEEKLDGARLRTQMETIRDAMLSASECGTWLTLEEIAKLTGYHEASISAQLRHLRNGTGGYKGPRCVVEKRRRGAPRRGLWEYQVRLAEVPPTEQLELTACGR